MAKKQNKAEANASKTEEKKPKARKTAKKAEKQQNLEDILFECRNKLRGNANMTTKRDMLLTLVFLRLICSRFNEQKEKIKSDVLTNLGKAEDALSAEERDFVTMMQENKSSLNRMVFSIYRTATTGSSLSRCQPVNEPLPLITASPN